MEMKIIWVHSIRQAGSLFQSRLETVRQVFSTLEPTPGHVRINDDSVDGNSENNINDGDDDQVSVLF